ncbi:MAG: aldehyde ferredoxin oxidoreductase C-terminal domain-containing protein [Desulfobacterales bacterium]|nr:aldehyde ferredoxin oxidoreductase C-terminal domain-containing protein [Desulfobacterales bacterium]
MENLMLTIDLSNRSYEIEQIPQEVLRKYIGARGLGSYLLYRSVPAKADPFGEENHLIFTAGPANGTDFYYSSKTNINTKSPLTGVYLYSISSGILSHQIRKAGFWAVDIKGVADSPTYLKVENQKVQFRDAGPLWGMETAKAQQSMLEGASPKTTATVGIGPAGEKLIRYAGLFCDGFLYRCFGRGGAGSVMGSKKLKGMVVTGDREVKIADPERVEAIKKEVAHRLKTDMKGWADKWRRYETGSGLGALNEMGILPTRNWQTGQFEGWRGIDKSTAPMGWPEKGSRPCGPYCPTPGCREVQVSEGAYKGARSDIEYETIYAFGASCGVDQMAPIIAAGQICDEFGIDTMSAGLTIGFAMECFEKGLIDKTVTDGIDLRFGNHDAMIKVLRKITRQEGFGKQLAEGTRRLSGQIKGSGDFAIHAKGMELGGYECRGLNAQALQFAIDNRGGCHKGYGLSARQEAADNTRLDIAGKGKQVRQTGIDQILIDSTPVCSFSSRVINGPLLKDALNAMHGETFSDKDLEDVGMRVMCQERLFNMREGMTRADDTLPARLLKEPKPDGPTAGAVVPLEELKDDYYRAMGYDPSTGNPPDSLLAALGVLM